MTGECPGQTETSLWLAPTFSQIVRSPLALPACYISEGIGSLEELVLGIGAVLSGEVALLVAAALLMPYAAAGERTPRLLGRCVRLTLWATTSLVVLGLAEQAIELFVHSHRLVGNLQALAIALYVAWLVWMWMRSAARYLGAAEGPGWEPRWPRCEACGYRLTGLTAADRCPECGLPVAQSLPDSRRPPAFALAQSRLQRIPAFLRTFAGVLFDRRFFRRLAIDGGHPAARRFAVWVCVLVVPVTFVSAWAVATALGVADWPPDLDDVREFACDAALPWAVSVPALLCLLGLLGLTGTLIGPRPMARSATVVWHWSAWVLPVVLSSALGLVCCGWLLDTDSHYLSTPVNLLAFGRVDLAAIFAAACLVIPLLMLTVAFVRLWQATRQTRFASG